MADTMNQMVIGKKNNVASLLFKERPAFYDRKDAACHSTQCFLKSASQLPEHEYLGLHIKPASERKCCICAYTGEDTLMTMRDYEWIFEGCCEGVAGVCDHSVPFPVMYWLSDSSQNDGEISERRKYTSVSFRVSDEQYFEELLKALAQVGGEVYLTASENTQAVLICLSEEMSVRMKAILSFALPGTAVQRVGEPDSASKTAPPLHRATFGNMITGVVSAKMKEIEKEGTGLEELGLSIRTRVVLEHEGYRYVEQVANLRDEELLKIRNFGFKTLREVKEKLAEYNGEHIQVPTQESGFDYTAELAKLIGLGQVKEQVKKIKAFARMKHDLQTKREKTIPCVLNMEFTGNPGTAKTTVARLLAGILHEIGLCENELVEVGRADLVARYEGQTAQKVKDVFEHAKGKVLFIDEAYSLVESHKGNYGDEAISTIVQEMENLRDEIIVIFAGYPKEMEQLFACNPGLRSRVPFHLEFDDYSDQELVRITQLEAEKRGFRIEPEALDMLENICAYAAADPSFGNGRFCRNLAESAILAFAERHYADGSHNDVQAIEFVLTPKDFVQPIQMKNETPKIGFVA